MKLHLHFFSDNQIECSPLENIKHFLAQANFQICQTLVHSEFSPLTIDIILVNDVIMKEKNLKFRQQDKSTDVLTFAPEQKLFPGEKEYTGEIYISLDTAKKQAQKNKISLDQEICILIVHGVLHAYGYDHELSQSKALEMQALEKKILTSVQLNPQKALIQV